MHAWLDFFTKLLRHTPPLHTADQLARSAKSLMLLCLMHCLQPMMTPILIRWKNIKIQCWLWFCIVGAVFNTTTMWYFQCLCALLRKNHKMLFVFPHFIMSVTLLVNCDIGSRQENGVLEVLIAVGTFTSTSSFNTQRLQFVTINKLKKVYVPGGL